MARKSCATFRRAVLCDGESSRAVLARSHRHTKHRLLFWLAIKRKSSPVPLSSRYQLCILSYAVCECCQLAGQLLSIFSWNPEGSASLARSR